MNTEKKVLYTGKAHTTGGREGVSRTDDGRLDLALSTPGTAGTGTNPEQLFAVGWSACFLGALGIAANKMKVKLPPGTADDIEIDLCLTGDAFSLQARHNLSLPGLDPEVARALAEAAHLTCPYSKATHGNIDVVTNINVA
ncbi:MAG: organic hydroperoxide resistance protein [Polyangiaceae bacterium]